MRKTLAAILLLASVLGAQAWDQSAMNKTIDQTNFLVNDNCSATLIDPSRGYLLTADHCISAQFKIIERQKIDDKGVVTTEKVRVTVPGTVSQIYYSGTDEIRRVAYSFKVVANDKTMDLALVQTTPIKSNVGASVSCVPPTRGDTVYAVGNPMGVLYASVSKGIVASTTRNYRTIGVDEDSGLVQATAPIGGGNSGGALFNDSGEIIGVNVRGYQAVSPLGLSVPLGNIRKFLKDSPMKLEDCNGEK